MSPSPDLSIIVVSWNTAGLLKACLHSIRRNAADLESEVIVVDNGSSDGSVGMVMQRFAEAILIANPTNAGYARANNQGLSRASGRYVLLLNSDTEVTEGALDSLLAYMEGHPRVGAVGPRLLRPDGTVQRSCDLFPLRPWEMAWERIVDCLWPQNTVTRRGRMARWDLTQPLAVDWLVGAALLVRRDVIETVGGLDERFWMYAEDLDWCYRMRKAGWEVHYLPHATVYHWQRASSERTPQLAGQLARQREESLVLFYRKHYGAVAALGLKIILACRRRRKG
ncbi:MAG: glycosyltransferase family 2 protein [Anaerolineae bacterium]|nr:glycosyltransferase family 2 protein [Anaerolineae bacterium]